MSYGLGGMPALAALAMVATPRIEEGIRRVYKDAPDKPDSEPEPAEPKIEVEDGIPRQVSVAASSPNFHGGISSNIGVRIDGEERRDVRVFDLDTGAFQITGQREPIFPAHAEVYWRSKPSRQVLRRLRRGG